jgi:hypothetical protein
VILLRRHSTLGAAGRAPSSANGADRVSHRALRQAVDMPGQVSLVGEPAAQRARSR